VHPIRSEKHGTDRPLQNRRLLLEVGFVEAVHGEPPASFFGRAAFALIFSQIKICAGKTPFAPNNQIVL
jgi:hypothetical protein